MEWKVPDAQPSLSPHEVHIWKAVLDRPSESVQELKGALSIDERNKAERLRFERDKNRFIVARAVLRTILGSYLKFDTSAIRFCYDSLGKPGLQKGFDSTGIQFSLSHSEGIAVYALTRDHRVGVDVEYIHEISEMEQIVSHLFSVREQVLFTGLSSSEKQLAFFSWWTRKEAFSKAAGQGVSALRTCDASRQGALGVSGSGKEGTKWSSWAVSPAQQFAGTVVAEGEGFDVQYWKWRF